MKQNNSNTDAGIVAAAALVTLQDLNAMSAFIRNFKMKYADKREPLVKKKQ